MADRDIRMASIISNNTSGGEHKPFDMMFAEYSALEGDEPAKKHMRREFCSQLMDLPFRLQEMVIANQSSESLERLLVTLKRFKSPDTGYLTHAEEITRIENELNSRGGKKHASSVAMEKDLRAALNDLANRMMH